MPRPFPDQAHDAGHQRRLCLLPCLPLLLLSLISCVSATQNLPYADARTTYSAAQLSAACLAPVHATWGRCVRGGGKGGNASAPAATRSGRAIVLPPFPRFAVVNPMHALADHIWAWATMFAACVDNGSAGDEATIVLMGVRRSQIERWKVSENITARLDLDLSNFIPKKRPDELPDPLAGPPTWGQWVLHMWAKRAAREVLYADDIEKMQEAGVCFDDKVLAVDADFFGTAFRAVRIDFWPARVPRTAAMPAPWSDYPERWKMRGIAELRKHVLAELGLEMDPRRRSAPSESKKLRVLLTTRRGDFRRRWQNADAAIVALERDMAGKVELKIVDNLEGMSLLDQAQAYNWADVLVGIHGASMANALFMRDGTAVVEVWRCCYDRIQTAVERQISRAWTGWVMQRTHMTLTYLSCTEVDPDGALKPLAMDEKNKTTDELCGMNKHMNAITVAVDPASVVTAVKAAAADAAAKIGFDPIPLVEWMPSKDGAEPLVKSPIVGGRIGGKHSGEKGGNGQSGVRSSLPKPKPPPQLNLRHVRRLYTPVGPAWTTAAVYNDRVKEQLRQFENYLRFQAVTSGKYWLSNQQRHERGLAPLPLDSMSKALPVLNESIAFQVGVIPAEDKDAGFDGREAHGGGIWRHRRRPYFISSLTPGARMELPRLEESLLFLVVACCVLVLWGMTLFGSFRLCARSLAARAFGNRNYGPVPPVGKGSPSRMSWVGRRPVV